jgi:hypothetical protein
MNWIRGNDNGFESKSIRGIAPIPHIGARSVFDKNDGGTAEKGRNGAFGGNDSGKEPRFAFEISKRPGLARGMSPKTHAESESNFDEFLQRFDKKREHSQDSEKDQSRTLAGIASNLNKMRPGVPTGREGRRSMTKNNDDSDLLHFSTERSSDNPPGHNFRSGDPTKGVASNSNLRKNGQSRGVQESSEEIRELLHRDKRNNSFDVGASNEIKKSSEADPFKGKLGSDKKRSSTKGGFETIFTNKAFLERDPDAKAASNRDQTKQNRPSSSVKESIQSLEQDALKFSTRPSIVKLGQRQTEAKTARTVESAIMSDDQVLFLKGSDVREKEPSSNSNRQPDKSPGQNQKAIKARYLMGPLNVQKFIKIVHKVCQRAIVRALMVKFQEKSNRRKFALDTINSLFKKRIYFEAKHLFGCLEELPQRREEAATALVILHEVIENTNSIVVANAFSKILKFYLYNKNALFKNSFDRMIHKIDQAKTKSLLKIAQLSDAKIEAIKRLVMKKTLMETQIARRYLLEWLQACRGGCHNIERALVKLGLMAQTRKKRDLLRGYYGIKAAGGRFEKLFILVSRRFKLDQARVKYCFKKLSIWNRFRRGVTEGGDAVRTIIVRTDNSHAEQQLNSLNRMFRKQSMDKIIKIFTERVKNDKVEAIKGIRAQAHRRKTQAGLIQILHKVIFSRPCKKVWIELQLFLLQQRSIIKATGSVAMNENFSPKQLLKGRSFNQTQARVGKNPLFTYFEEKTQRSRTETNRSSESIAQSHSNELEILRSGIELDTKLQLNKPKIKPAYNPMELVGRLEEKHTLPKQVQRIQHSRILLTKLHSILKKTLRLSWESILDATATGKLNQVNREYHTMGLKRLHRVLINRKSREFNFLLSVLSAMVIPSKIGKKKPVLRK